MTFSLIKTGGKIERKSSINPFFELIYRKIAYICPKEGYTEKEIEIKILKFFTIFLILRVPPLKMEFFVTFKIKSKHRYQNWEPLVI